MKIVFGVFLCLALTSANAALIPVLAGQAVYDSELDITWIADAKLAATTTFGLQTGVDLGIHPSDSDATPVQGFINDVERTMNWPGALFWIDAMNAANYLGFNDWRLPTTAIPDPSCSQQFTHPSGDYPTHGYGDDCTGSEMGHLFYDELGGEAGSPVWDSGDPDLALFSNISSEGYYSGTEYEQNPNFAYFFDFDNGNQSWRVFPKGISRNAWAVRDGNAGVIPVPPAFLLFGSALGLLGWMRRKAA